jgi:hypothetical protein
VATAGSSQLPIRYRLAAVAVTVVVHSAVLLLALFWQGDMRAGQQSLHGNAAGEEIIQIEFVPAQKQTDRSHSSVIGKVSKQSATAETVSAPDQEQTGNTLAGTADGKDKPISSPSIHDASVRLDASDPDNGYISEVRAAVMRQWQMDGGGAIPAGCGVAIDQIEGGKAVRAWTANCTGLTMGERIRLEISVMRARLPSKGFESMVKAHLEVEL